MSPELHGLRPFRRVPQGRGGNSPNACQVLYPFRRLSQGWSGDSFSLLSRSAPRFPCVENPVRRFLQLFITDRAPSASCWKSSPSVYPAPANARTLSAVRRKSRAVFSSAFYYGPRLVSLVLKTRPVGSFCFPLRAVLRLPRAGNPARRFIPSPPMSALCPLCAERVGRRFLQLFITDRASFPLC